MNKYFKMNQIALVVLLISSAGLLQAAVHDSREKEYLKTRQLIASLGLRYTNDLVMDDEHKHLVECCKVESNAFVNEEMRTILSSGRFSVSQFENIRDMVNQKYVRKDLEIKLADKKKGYGVFATQDMPKDTFIGVYAGEINDFNVGNEHYSFSFEGIVQSDVLYCYVDAFKCGNVTRFVNHSNNQNCSTINILDENQVPQIVFITRDPIKKGQEVTINYGEGYNWDKKPIKSEVIISK